MLKIENEVMNAVFENKTVAQTEQELHTHAACQGGLSAEESAGAAGEEWAKRPGGKKEGEDPAADVLGSAE